MGGDGEDASARCEGCIEGLEATAGHAFAHELVEEGAGTIGDEELLEIVLKHVAEYSALRSIGALAGAEEVLDVRLDAAALGRVEDEVGGASGKYEPTGGLWGRVADDSWEKSL